MATVMVMLGAGEVSLRATYGAATQIESALDAPLEDIYRAHTLNGLTFVDLARIVEIGMKSADEAADPETIVKHIFNQHLKTDEAFRKKIAEYLLALAWSPENRAKKLEDEWSDSTDTSAPIPELDSGLYSASQS